MSAIKTLYRHSSHYLGGRLVLMLLGFASFPIFTRIFSVADYGIISLISNTVSLFVVVSKFGFQNAVQRYYPEAANSADPDALPRYYATLFYGTALIAALLTLAFALSIPFGSARFLGISATGALFLATSLIIIRSLRSMQMNLLQMENKTKLFNIMDTVQKALGITLTILLLLFWRKSIFAFFLGAVAVEGAIVMQYWPFMARRRLLSPWMVDGKFLRNAIAFSFPLMAAEITWLVLDVGDRFFVQHFLGSQSLGYYSAAYGVATYWQEMLTVPLQLALFPICMKLWSSKGRQETQTFLSRSLDQFLMASVGVVCVAMVTSRDVIVVLASKKFQEAHELLPYLVIGLVLCATMIFFRPGLLIFERASKIATATLYACVLNIAMNIVLLPRIGMVGAAIATMVSYAAMVAFLAYESWKVLPFKVELLSLARYVAVGAGVAWLVSRLSLPTPLVGAVVKGALVVTLYAAVLWLVDRRARELMGKAWALLMNRVRPQSPPSLAPAGKEEMAVNR